VIEENWGDALTVGVEEEVMIFDGESYDPAPAVETLVRESEATKLPGKLKTELFAWVVELNTNKCKTPEDALEAIRTIRRAAADIAAEHGLRIAAGGSHPIARPEEQEIAPDQRYREFVEYAGISALRQGVNGLHVHVGMPSAETCMHVLEGVLPWLPLVLALSANSPYLAGEETGLASNRAEILAQLPRHGAPPAFSGYEGWQRFVERFVRLGLAEDYTRFWWDLRPHPKFGTLEIRMPDQPTSADLTGAFVALVQALCAMAQTEDRKPLDPAGRGIYSQNRWAALRFGPRAELIHPDGERLVTVPDLFAELRGRIEASPLLDPLDGRRCEGDRQLEVGRGRGLDEVCADLVERTVAS
jgi:carboxylate-amine ligase